MGKIGLIVLIEDLGNIFIYTIFTIFYYRKRYVGVLIYYHEYQTKY